MDLESFLRRAKIPPMDHAEGWYAAAFVTQPAPNTAPPAEGVITIEHDHSKASRMASGRLELLAKSVLKTRELAVIAITYRNFSDQPFLFETVAALAARYGFPKRAAEQSREAFRTMNQISALQIDGRYGVSARDIGEDSTYTFSPDGMRRVLVARTAVQSNPVLFSQYFPLVVPAVKMKSQKT